jgi:hypothetical protein
MNLFENFKDFMFILNEILRVVFFPVVILLFFFNAKHKSKLLMKEGITDSWNKVHKLEDKDIKI